MPGKTKPKAKRAKVKKPGAKKTRVAKANVNVKPDSAHVASRQKILHAALNPTKAFQPARPTRRTWRGTPDPHRDRLVPDVARVVAHHMAMQDISDNFKSAIDKVAWSMRAHERPQVPVDPAAPGARDVYLAGRPVDVMSPVFYKLFSWNRETMSSMLGCPLARIANGRMGWIAVDPWVNGRTLAEKLVDPSAPPTSLVTRQLFPYVRPRSRVLYLTKEVVASDYTEHLRQTMLQLRLGHLQRVENIAIERTMGRSGVYRDGLHMNVGREPDKAAVRFKLFRDPARSKTPYPTVVLDLLLPVENSQVRSRTSIHLPPFHNVHEPGTVRGRMLHVSFAFFPSNPAGNNAEYGTAAAEHTWNGPWFLWNGQGPPGPAYAKQTGDTGFIRTVVSFK